MAIYKTLDNAARKLRLLPSLAFISLLASAAATAETIKSEGLSALAELRLVDASGTQPQRLQVIDRAGATVVDTDKALPRIENAYSPHSYDGYLANLVAEPKGKIAVTDTQGERYILLSPSAQAGDYLVLITREDGNGAYNFNLKFRYDGAAKSFALSQVLLNENNTACDQSLLSTYAFDSNVLASTSITDFDGTRAFGDLKDLRLTHQTSGTAAKKLMPETASSNFNAALKAYKAGDHEELQTLAGYFMAEDDEGACDPGDYIVEKYYFPEQVGWSNDLGFLFEQAGYYQEATALLEHITRKHPDRVVAYLNLADAYWAMDNKASAQKAYGQYHEKMVATGKQARIPERVIARK